MTYFTIVAEFPAEISQSEMMGIYVPVCPLEKQFKRGRHWKSQERKEKNGLGFEGIEGGAVFRC